MSSLTLKIHTFYINPKSTDMKNLILLIVLILSTISISVNAQPCLPNGISFSSQAEIDNFKANYPNCTEIEGKIEIDGAGITNLDSLHLITSVGGYVEIYSIPDLVSIEGLSSLVSIGSGRLFIHNTALTSLHGLENLISVPGLRITENPLLASLDGLSSLTKADGGLYIDENPVLTDISALENLTFVGQGGDLSIVNNDLLSSLSGLDNIFFDVGYVTNIWVDGNPLLSECEVASFCNYLDDGGTMHLANNADGCNSKAEIIERCNLSVGEMNLSINIQTNPNPCSGSTNFKYHLTEPSHVTITVYSPLGQEVEILCNEYQQEGDHNLNWDTSTLPAGIYSYLLNADNIRTTGKVIVLR